MSKILSIFLISERSILLTKLEKPSFCVLINIAINIELRIKLSRVYERERRETCAQGAWRNKNMLPKYLWQIVCVCMYIYHQKVERGPGMRRWFLVLWCHAVSSFKVISRNKGSYKHVGQHLYFKWPVLHCKLKILQWFFSSKALGCICVS